MTRQENIDLLEHYFTLMQQGEWAAVEDMYHDDIVIHMLGTTPASGRMDGKAMVTDDLIAEKVHGALVPETIKFARNWKIMCADDERVVAIMEGGGEAKSGVTYDQTYCEIFRFKDGKVIEMHAFFDTALAESALFDNALARPRNPSDAKMDY
ncbi:nuclear transport factor 2 family protein [Parasphingorhabdus sp.]|uniref:nuclear transport factor 2 family protein n=1 Tax=Parasphingorhabdus sp. TaxID=2709688 RepID=UPI0030A4701B|nr:nuclear transport factor 2 family protein [Sphingomonadales bacterium]